MNLDYCLLSAFLFISVNIESDSVTT